MRRALGIVAVMLGACVLATPALAGKKDDTLRFASQDTLESVDPYYNNIRIGAILANHVWDTLVYRDPATGAYNGQLATSWKWIDDRTLEFELRRGVKFHNGAGFNADDVVYTLNFVSKPENRAIQQSFVDWIGHVEKVDDYKVRIVTKEPFPAAIAYFASWSYVIHPHEYYAKVGPKGMSEKPIGTGPYRVIEHARGKYVRLERNRDYFKDSPKAQPKIDKVEIRFVPDAQIRVAEMVARGLDLVMNVARDQADQLRSLPSLQIIPGGTTRYGYLHMNTMANGPAPQLRDVRVRRAIMHAVDRGTMVKFLVADGSHVIHAECYPSQFGCSDDGVLRYEYDPAKARRLLAEAGYPNGFAIDIYGYQFRTELEAIIGYLNAVGIKARLRFMQYPAIRTAIRNNRAPIVHNNWGSYSIADVVASLSVFHEFSPDDMNRDPEIRDLLLRADHLMDADLRKAAYGKALKLVAERAYLLPLYTMPTYYLAAKDLVFKPYDDEMPRFYEMSWK